MPATLTRCLSERKRQRDLRPPVIMNEVTCRTLRRIPMPRRLLATSALLALATAVVAAPIKSTSETVTDRAGYIPLRKQQSLAGKVVGVLVSDPQAVLATEGRSGPKDQLCFGRGGGGGRWGGCLGRNDTPTSRQSTRHR